MDALMVEIDGRRLHTEPGGGSWWLTGLEGFYDSPGTQFDETLIPGQDGAFDPEDVLLEPRRVTIRGECEVSSRAWADNVARAWLASLAKKSDLNFRAYVGGKWVSLRFAKVRGQIKVRDLDETSTEFEIPVWAADPIKYGPTLKFDVDATVAPSGGMSFPIVDGAISFGVSGAVTFPGAFQLYNPGTAGFYPAFTVRGPVASFTITSEGRVIEFVSPVPTGKELVLSPYLGGRAVLDGVDVSHNLTQAGWAPVLGGQTRGYLFNALKPGLGAQLEVRYPEGAWW